MKIRSSFVSNSSSSSFICEVCGEVLSGWNLNYEQAEMVECVKGHMMCQDHVYTNEEIEEIEENIPVNGADEDEEDWRMRVPVEKCPICSLEEIQNQDVLRYLLAKHNISMKEVCQEIRGKYKDLDDFEANHKPCWEM